MDGARFVNEFIILLLVRIFVFDSTTNMQFSKMQNEIYESWLRYTAAPNVTTLFTSLLLYFWRQTWPGNCLFSNSDHRLVFTPLDKRAVTNVVRPCSPTPLSIEKSLN